MQTSRRHSNTLLALGTACALTAIFASCKGTGDIDAVFQTTAQVRRSAARSVYENRVKFTLVDQIRPSLEKFAINTNDISMNYVSIAPQLSGIPASLLDQTLDALVYIELVKSETDIVAENRTPLFVSNGTTLRTLSVSKTIDPAGAELLKQIIAQGSDIKHVLVTFQIVFQSPPVDEVALIDLDMNIGASMNKYYDNIF